MCAGGLVITGGGGALNRKSVEVWSPASGHVCSGPDLPEERTAHSASKTALPTLHCSFSPVDLTPAGIVVCGRWNRNTQSSCIVWAPGSSTWTLHATIQSRYDHVSWLTSTDQLILIAGVTGGSSDFSPTEIVGVGPGFTLNSPNIR